MSEFKEHKIVWDDEKVSRLWDYYSRTYPYNQIYFTKTFGKDIIKKTEKLIGKLDNKVFLDFGCGPAFFIQHFVNLNIKLKKYVGLDFSEKSVESISKNINTVFPVEAELVQYMPSSLEDDSIDVCFLIEVVEHLNDEYLDSTLKEIYRVLKHNGILVITTPNNENLELSLNFCPECGCIYHRMQHVRVWNKKNLEQTINKYGFKTHKIVETNFITRQSILKDFYIIAKGLIKNESLNLYGVFIK